MPLIWCAISSHGYGHAAQVVPVLNALGRLVPGLRALLRTEVPESFFQGRLTIPWTVSRAPQDIGCVQQGPLAIDVGGTWQAHKQFHASWPDRIAHEAAAMQAARPALVLANVPPLAMQAAARAGLPVVGLCSLSWDQVLEPYLSTSEEARAYQLGILEQMRDAYAVASLTLRPTPGLPMSAFKRVVDLAPILHPTAPAAAQLRAALGASSDEPLVLVGFGGIPLASLPLARLEAMPPYRFLLDRLGEGGGRRLQALDRLPFPFGVILASVDVVVTKPGYSTIVEAVHHQRPIVYVRRYTFADEAGLVDYLHRYGRGVELSADAFGRGQWQEALESLEHLPLPAESPPAPTGAEEAARWLQPFLA